MKTEVIISNGYATLTLTPEFQFEKDVIEAMYKDDLAVLDAHADCPSTSLYNDTRKHKIQLRLGKRAKHIESHEPQGGC